MSQVHRKDPSRIPRPYDESEIYKVRRKSCICDQCGRTTKKEQLNIYCEVAQHKNQRLAKVMMKGFQRLGVRGERIQKIRRTFRSIAKNPNLITDLEEDQASPQLSVSSRPLTPLRLIVPPMKVQPKKKINYYLKELKLSMSRSERTIQNFMNLSGRTDRERQLSSKMHTCTSIQQIHLKKLNPYQMPSLRKIFTK